MNFIDIVIIIVGLLALYFGFRKGIIKQLGAIAALIVGIIAARLLYKPVGIFVSSFFTHLSSTADSNWASYFVGAVLVFIVVYLIVRIAVSGVASAVKLFLLGPIDRILGACFLVLEWLTLLSILLNLWITLWPESKVVSESTLADGAVAHWVMNLGPWLLGMIK